MSAIDKISKLHPHEVSNAELARAVLELATDLKQAKADIASGRVGATITDIDPDRIEKTTGQSA